MGNKKGFTLVELLAVLVVLSIILAIAVPTIGNVIKNSTRNAFAIDARMVLKAVDYKRIENENFDPLVVTKENMMEQIGLDSSQYAQVTFRAKETKTELILVGAGKWDGLIAYGTIDNMRVVNSEDYDETPPAITILGDNPVEVGKGSTYSDAGATATDLKDGDVPITSTVIKNESGVVVDNVDTSTFTTYTVTYTAVDSQGNIGSAARQVIVADKTAPVITILGDNPTTININDVYSDAGATALDETDGDITSKIEITGTINPSVVGTYTITYTVNDNANNQAVATRTVNVLDNVLPTVAFGTNGNVTYAKSRSTTVTVNDNVSVDESSLKYQWTTSITTPTEISFNLSFTNGETIDTPVGVTGGYYLWILGKDTSGNTIIAGSNVFNLDNTIPVITLNGSSTVTINKGSTYSDAGATATDAHSDVAGSVTATGTVNPSIVGTYTITYNVNDNAGNEATPVVRIINVIDVSAPVITILGINPVSINLGSTYTDAGATALDDVDGNVTSRIVVTGTVNPSIAGTYTITYTVKDNANNQAVATRTVNVLDNVSPTVAFSMNGNATYAKSRSTTVTVSDNVSVNTSSLKYQWTTSTTAPTEASFMTTFTNGGTISTLAGVTGGYYLWILGKDTTGNTMISRSNVFNLDNVVPTITLVGSNPVYISSGSTYNDTGVIANDNADGIITGRVTSSTNLNTSVVGTYTMTFNVSDTAGNAATPVTRTISVVSADTNFAYTGGVQSVIVPQGVTKAIIEVYGSGGGGDQGANAAGGYAKGTFYVTPGQVLYVYVGNKPTGGVGGFNGGGSGGRSSYGGGGATDVRLNGTTLNDRIIVAGGGGGIASWTDGYGGAAGGTTGACGSGNCTYGGGGGTQIAGGSGGNTYGSAGSAGSLGQGGNGGSSVYDSESRGGGGGGGGYYGGGGGGGGQYSDSTHFAGGGGSSYIKAGAINTEMKSGSQTYHSGNGSARIIFVSSISEYTYTGAVQQYVTKTPRVQIEVWGAGGGTTSQWGGSGGYAKGIFNITASQTLYIYVGGTNSGETGGWNGGGNAGGYYAMGGGGATDVRLNGTALSDRIIVAGGGGGAAEYGGGSGGGLSGTNVYDGVGGYGGTQTAGGGGGGSAGYGGGSAGTLGIGGRGGCIDYCGGGGGGGYYGGGGGNGSYSEVAKGGGGGGSGYIRSDATVTEMQTGVRSGNGFVRITDIP